MIENAAKIKYFLGVDYGEAKIGLALADSETRIAFAYGVLKNDQSLFEHILNIIKKEHIARVIIGVPARINSKKTVYAGEKLGAYLERETSIFVEYQNEMYSTKIARENLKEKGLKKISRFDDEEAARIILDSFLQKKEIIKIT